MTRSIRCFPSSDRTFAERVGAVLGPAVDSGDMALSAIETLRTEYPRVRVVRQSDLARSGTPVLYVYRDGEILEPAGEPG